jgi:hypothetical protein
MEEYFFASAAPRVPEKGAALGKKYCGGGIASRANPATKRTPRQSCFEILTTKNPFRLDDQFPVWEDARFVKLKWNTSWKNISAGAYFLFY